ncbi:MAG TPA: DNA-directed RNA polymerase subunit D, partial [Archaeoglobus veneficus]|nr:DNA-directed RNA polymerase subunit D [Archaeoglobus veneficus]
MKIEIIDEDEFNIKFILYDAPIAFANSFRRAMKSLV